MTITTLKDKALLVSLSVRKPQLTKKDYKATADAEIANNAHGAGKYVKDLYPKHLIDPITQVESEARAYMYSRTVPWQGNTHLLPSVDYIPFALQMGKFTRMFEQSVTAFLNNYASALTTAQAMQGDMYNASEYPDLSELKGQFSLSARYFPVSDENDFRLKVSNETLVELKASAEAQVRETMAEASRVPYQRLLTAVERVHTQCSKPTGKIYDTLMDGLAELVEYLPALNFTGDKRLADLIDECRAKLVRNPNMLRVDPDAKQDTADEAKIIMDKMRAFL